MTLGIAAVAALGCAAGTFYWLHARLDQPAPAVASEELSGSDKTHLADKNATAAVEAASASAVADKAAPPIVAGQALRAGEALDYTANVSKLSNVANLTLRVVDRRDFLGKSAWHLQALAHTENPLRMVFELDDQFDSYSDVGTLTSLQYEMHLNERGQKVESVQRMTATGNEPAPANATAARVLPGTRDPLGMMHYLRNVDWPSRIDVRVFDNGVEMKDASFILYLANNAARTPVLLEATMPFATARVELIKAK